MVSIDRAEQDRLILTHLPLVGYQVAELARRLPSHVRRDDLASAGAFALVQAGRRFDPERGVPFARYAGRRIRGAIVDELRSMDWAPRGSRSRAKHLSSIRDQLTLELSRPPTREELADALGTDVAAVDAAQGDVERRVLSLDAASAALADTLPAPTLSPEDRVLLTERLDYLTTAIAELPDRQRQVIEALFLHDRPATAIADELGVTTSRISQLRSQALQMLKDAMTAAFEPALARATPAFPGVAERRRQDYCAAVASRGAASPKAPAGRVARRSGS
jgi:RNA polymerase sigma factor FliA